MPSVKKLMQSLRVDTWREKKPFSDDILLANKVLLNRFAYNSEKAKALSLWIRPNQPCVFGTKAASKGRMHFCILSDDDLYSSDRLIKEKIQRARLLWKRASLKNQAPGHGFMLLATSEKILYAAPDDENLFRLACRLRGLWGCEVERDEEGNDIAWETLFLHNPTQNYYVKFTFSLDYFGAQGDQRWWHDHRVPGGIGFTANSLGHMARTQEWYESGGPQIEWAVKLAMLTVDRSAEIQWGKNKKAIWLEELERGQPHAGKGCPFSDVASLPENLRNKDWSSYSGYLSTDHSIRKEFFRSEPEIPKDIDTKWLQDLTYIYDPTKPDYRKFMEGEPVSEPDVFKEIGSPRTWRRMPLAEPVIYRSREQEQEIVTLLAQMEEKWGVNDPDAV
jgi:hypothetical protein